jgi:hypothetical protein
MCSCGVTVRSLGFTKFAAPDTWWQHRRASLLIMCDMGPAERAKARAMHATACDVEALRQAINLQESSAIMFERVHETGKSRNARSVQIMPVRCCCWLWRSKWTCEPRADRGGSGTESRASSTVSSGTPDRSSFAPQATLGWTA